MIAVRARECRRPCRDGRLRVAHPMRLKGAKGAPTRVVGPPGEISVRRPHGAGAPLRCSLSPPRCSPLVRVRSPPSDSHRSASPNDRHRVVAVLMDGYFAQDLSQPGPHWVAVALPGDRHRQTPGQRPLSPPGGGHEELRAGPPWRADSPDRLEQVPAPHPLVTRAPTCLDHSDMPSYCPGDSEPTH